MVFEELQSTLELDASDYISSATDAASATEQVGDSTESTEQSLLDINAAGVAAGGGMAGVGTAAQNALDSTQPLRESLGRTSESLGLTREETQGLATDLSNATFPLDDAVGTMDELARAGIDGEVSMRETATAADMVADATGTTATTVAQNAVPALKAMGEDAASLTEHMDTFTFIARNTQMSVEDFSRLVTKAGPEIEEMGLSVDDTAAIMAALEEKGLDSRTAMSEFRQAARDADGDQQQLMETLGLSNQELDSQRQNLHDAEGATRRHADAANESLTTMDQLRSSFADATLVVSDMIGPLSGLAPALQAAGGAAVTFSTINFSAVIPSISGVNIALSPLLPIILGLVAVAGTLALAWKNNWGDIQGKVQSAGQVIQQVIGDIRQWVGRLVDIVHTAIGGDFAQAWSMAETLVHDTITAIGNWLREQAVPTVANALRSLGQQGIAGFSTLKQELPPLARQAIQSTGQWIRTSGVSLAKDALSFLAAHAVSGLERLAELGLQAVQAGIDGIANWLRTSATSDIKSAFKAIGSGVRIVALGWFTLNKAVGKVIVGFIGDLVSYLTRDAAGDLKTAGEALFNAAVTAAAVTLATLTPPDGIIAQIVGAIVAYLKNDAWGDLKAAAEFLFDAVIVAAQGLYEGLIGGSIIPAMVVDILAAIRQFGSDLVGAFTGLIQTALAVWLQFTLDWYDLLFSTISDILSAVGQFGSELLSTLSQALTRLKQIVGRIWAAINQSISNTLNRIRETVERVWATINGSVTGTISSLKRTLSRTWTQIQRSVTATLGTIKRTITDEFDTATENATTAIGDMAETVMDWLTGRRGPLSNVHSAGKELINGFINGIKDKAGAVEDAVAGVTKEARDQLPFSPAKEGPLSDLDDTGPGFVETIASGIEANTATLVSAAEAAALAARPPIQWPGLASPAQGHHGPRIGPITIEVSGAATRQDGHNVAEGLLSELRARGLER